jgi:hypothetical protein
MAYYVVKIIIKDYIFWCFLIRASGNLGLLSVAKKKRRCPKRNFNYYREEHARTK